MVDHPDFEVDRIAAWMAAGDDIILAENDVQSESESHLENILVNLSNKIKIYVRENIIQLYHFLQALQ